MSGEDPAPRLAEVLSDLFDELPAGCLILDARGRIERVNATLTDWLGRDDEDLSGRPFVDLLTVGGRLYYANTHQLRERVGGEVHEVSYDLRHADGSTVPVLLSTRRLSGGQALYLAYKAEVRRRYEAQLLEAKRASDESNRARKTFINTITHEVRTPIHGVLGIADLLRGTSLDATQSRLIDILADSAGALLGLVNDVLDLSRAEASALRVHAEPTELATVVDAVTASLRPTLTDEAVDLRSEVGADCPPWVMVDAGKLRQVLTNLVANAIKFTERGSVVLRVDCRGSSSAAEDRVALTFAVRDTGPGIPAHERATIFAPFGQASSTIAAGTGLGLTISQRIARALGGEITLRSELGRGSTFTFTLNVQETAKAAQTTATAPGAGGGEDRLRGRTVLVVDDNTTNLFIARRHLKRLGVETIEAASGPEALALARERPFDLVMLDLRMPGMDGFEVAQRLRDLPTFSATPLLAVTAASYPDDRPRDAELRFAGRLLKPFTFPQLRGALLEHLPDRSPGLAQPGDSMLQHPENPPGEPEPTAAVGETPASINRERLLDEFGQDDDPTDLVEFLGFSRDDLLAERSALVEGARTGDTAAVRDRRHKLLSILQLVGPQPLWDLLAEAVDADYAGDRERLADQLDISILGAVRLIDEYAAEQSAR